MFDTRLTVTNHERWGKLVKTWSTGVNYLDDGRDYTVPTTMEEFATQVEWAQAGATIPANYTKIQFVIHSDPDTLIVKLPPKDEIRKSEEMLMSPGREYPIPHFYSRVLFGGRDPSGPTSKEDLLDLHAARIGDYTVSICT